jgi:hypothetical protein
MEVLDLFAIFAARQLQPFSLCKDKEKLQQKVSGTG